MVIQRAITETHKNCGELQRKKGEVLRQQDKEMVRLDSETPINDFPLCGNPAALHRHCVTLTNVVLGVFYK